MKRRATRIVRSLAVAAAFLLAGAPPVLAQAAAPLEWKVPEGVKTIQVNGYPMAYLEGGSGVPVIFIHGAWVDYRLFAPQVEVLSKTNRAIAIGVRHHYPEPWDGKGSDYLVQQQAADVVAFIKAMKLEKVHLHGHSRGGGIALHAALQAPELIRTLILEEAASMEPLLADPSVAERTSANMARLAGFIRTKMDEGDRQAAAQAGWNAAYGPGGFEKMPPAIQQMVTDNIGTMAVPYPIAALACDDMRKLTFPVLIFHGETSPPSYRVTSKALQGCNTNIPDPVIVPNAGHNMHVNNPEFFNRKVVEFVQAH